VTPQRTRANIRPPEPDLTPDELVRRADSLRDVIRERQAECEGSGCLPEQTNQDFIRAGFYRTVQPRYFGGYEFDLPTFMKVLMAVSRGCAESGWVLALISGHPNLVARFPLEGQREAYGDSGEFLGPGVAMASGTAHQIDGGYRVKGTWDYASGCDLGTHFLGMTLVFPPGSEAPSGTAWVLFSRSECQIVNNWSVFGLQGTGSRRVEVGEHVVPDHRVAPWSDIQGRPAFCQPDPDVYVSPLFHGGVLPVLISELASVAVGAARGALDLYEVSLRNKRRSFPPFDTMGELPEFQQHFGEAQSLIDTAESALLGMGADYMERARRAQEQGAPLPEETQRRMLMIEQQCARLAWEAVELMFRTGGSASAGKSSALGRYFRNMAVLRTHITMQIDHTSINVARLHFGAPPLGPF